VSAQGLRFFTSNVRRPDALLRAFHIEMESPFPNFVGDPWELGVGQGTTVCGDNVTALQNDGKAVRQPGPLHLPKRILIPKEEDLGNVFGT
jgi:hypothetical protein